MTTTTLSPARARLDANARNLALWTFQGWLAMFFIAAGWAKVSEPMTNLVTLMGWPALAPENLVRGLGAVRVVDRTRSDFTRDPGTYDVVVDAVGKSSFGACRRLLRPRGRFVSTDLGRGAHHRGRRVAHRGARGRQQLTTATGGAWPGGPGPSAFPAPQPGGGRR